MVTRYVDSDRPDDSGDGLTPETAKKTFRAAYLTCVDGDSLLLRRDRFYTPLNAFFLTIKKKNFYLGAYGPSNEPLPVMDGMTWEPETADDWTPEGGGVWSKQFAVGCVVKRLWVGAVNTGNRRALRNPGTAYLCAKRTVTNTLTSIKAGLNEKEIWFSASATLSNKLYMYTGSDTINPPKYYKGIALLAANTNTFGANNVLQIQDSVNVLAENIELWGSLSGGAIITSNTSDSGHTRNITLRNIVSRYAFTNAVKVAPAAQNSVTPRKEISNILIDSCIGDSGTSPQEQEPTESYDFLSGSTDMFAVLDAVKNCRFVNCTSINSGHVAFTVGSYSLNSALPDNCGFENCKMYADPWHTYARGYTAYNCMDNCYIRRCVFDGQSVRCQNAGGLMVDSNTWINMRVSTRKANVSNWINISPEILDRGLSALGDDRYVYAIPTNLRIVNNLVIDPPQTPVDIQSFSAYAFPVAQPVIADNTVTIANNVIYDRVRSTTQRLVQIFSNATTVGKINFWNNVPYVGAGRPDPTITVQNVHSAVNAYAGAKNNLLEDPKIDITDPLNPQLERESPCRRAGAFVGHRKDAKGRPFMVPPTIGPLEYTAKTYRKTT